MKAEDLKLIVKEKYGEIASQSKEQNESSCCGSNSCCTPGMDYTVFSDDYTDMEGYNPEADLGLGCGLPVQYAGISKGDHVLDLGSGAGNDCFVARTQAGETGKVTGLDFTEEMLVKANENLKKTTYKNIEFIKGDIENMPFPDNSQDVIISNCVLNLVPDKGKAYGEIYRVLRTGGHFCISDVVIDGELPEKLLNAAEMYAGCVSGAMQKHDYINIINLAGFTEIEIKTEKEILIPNNILTQYLDIDELYAFKQQKKRILSITVTANK